VLRASCGPLIVPGGPEGKRDTLSVKIPPAADKVVAARSGGDLAAFLALFGTDGVVDDCARRRAEPAPIKGRRGRERIGTKGRLTVTAAGGVIFAANGERVRDLRTVAARAAP
jgi:hypothetical protein